MPRCTTFSGGRSWSLQVATPLPPSSFILCFAIACCRVWCLLRAIEAGRMESGAGAQLAKVRDGRFLLKCLELRLGKQISLHQADAERSQH